MGLPGLEFLKRVCQEIVMSRAFPVRFRTKSLRFLGMNNLETAHISPGVYMSDLSGVHGSGGCSINTQVFFDRGPISIGANVLIGARVIVLTSSHHIGPPRRRGGSGIHEPVVIGDGSWIGAGAIILPGVTIGAGCVIGAGSVVTKSCEPNGVYVGAPARRIKDLGV